jgi:hypothetical protein
LPERLTAKSKKSKKQKKGERVRGLRHKWRLIALIMDARNPRTLYSS